MLRLHVSLSYLLFLACFGFSALTTACGPGAFTCVSDRQCSYEGKTGRCEANGFCSLADPFCASGYRFSPYGGGEMCAPVRNIDAGVDAPVEDPDARSIDEAGEAGLTCQVLGLSAGANHTCLVE